MYYPINFLILRCLLTILLPFLIVACAAGSRRPPSRIGNVSIEEKTRIYRELIERSEALRTVEGDGLLLVGSSLSRRIQEFRVYLQRPTDFRLDVFSDEDTVEYQAVSHAGEIVILWHDRNRFFQGIGAPEELVRHLSIRLSLEEVVDFLTGTLPLEEEGDYRLTRRKGGRFLLRGEKTQIEVMPWKETYVPIRYIAKDIDGSTLYRIDYSQYSVDGDDLLPRRVLGRFQGARFDLRLETVRMNETFPRDHFDVTVPSGMERVYE